MFRSIVLLIVTMLLGSPGVALACELLWCVRPAAPEHHAASHCADSAALSGQAQLMSADGCRTPELTPFLSEARQTTSRVLTTTSTTHVASPPDASGRVLQNQYLFGGVPSVPPAFQTILRI